MTDTRRGFFGSILGVAAVAALPASPEPAEPKVKCLACQDTGMRLKRVDVKPVAWYSPSDSLEMTVFESYESEPCDHKA